MEVSRKTLVVTDQAFGNVTHEQAAAQAAGAMFRQFQCQTEEETIAAISGADVVLNNFAPMNRRVLQTLSPGSVIIRYGVGVDNVDLEAARELNLAVCNVPDYGIEDVADHACAFALALARNVPQFDKAVRKGIWGVANVTTNLPALRECTVGTVGYGRIARAFHQRMASFTAHALAYDPFVDAQSAKQDGVELVSLDELVARTHILSLHVPATAQTHRMMNAQRLASMPAGSLLINVSRGGLIDEAALAAALCSGHLAGAGLDVFEQEPPDLTAPLLKAPNLLTSPHAAFFSDASVKNLQVLAAQEALRALKGEVLRCPVVRI